MKPGEELSFFDFFDAIPDVMGLQDTERRVLLYNEAGYDMVGLSPEQVEGKHCYELIGRTEPCAACATKDAVDSGQPTSIVKFVPENGTWMNVRAYPIKDADGKVFRVVEHLRDVTESKALQVELERLNENLEREVSARTSELNRTIEELTTARDRLVETEKLSALGRMVAGFSHEVNTPLGIAVTSASFMMELLSNADNSEIPGELRESLVQACEMVTRNLDRSRELMTGFKKVAADQASERLRSIEPVEYLRDVVRNLHHEMKLRNVAVDIRGNEGKEFRTYPGALSQVVSSLIMNSMIHAYPEGGPGQLSLDIDRSGDGSLIIIYSDDGCGMDEDTVHRIYEPFFTTRIGGESIGLGLNIVYNLVVGRLNGIIRCDSTPGEGSRFTIEMNEAAEE